MNKEKLQQLQVVRLNCKVRAEGRAEAIEAMYAECDLSGSVATNDVERIERALGEKSGR